MVRLPIAVSLLTLIACIPLFAAEQPAVLFADDFATLQGGWGKASESLFVADNKLVMKMPAGVARIQLYQEPLGEELDIRVNLTEVAGGAEAMAGVAVWAKDPDNCYLVGLTSAGDVVVKSFVQGERSLPLPATSSPAIRQGLQKSNEVRVVIRDRLLSVYINGARTVTMRGFPPEGPTKFGLYGQSLAVPHTWAFANLSVRRPPSSNESAPSPDPSVLLNEPFAELDPGWGAPSEVVSVRDDRLVLEPLANTYFAALYSGAKFKDADTQITLVERTGDAPAGAGLIFWGVDQRNYALAMLKEGTLSVGRVTDGVLKNNASVADPVIKRGVANENVIRVVTVDDVAKVFVNGKEMASISGSVPKSGGKIGAYAQATKNARHTWEFSKLQVRKPE